MFFVFNLQLFHGKVEDHHLNHTQCNVVLSRIRDTGGYDAGI